MSLGAPAKASATDVKAAAVFIAWTFGLLLSIREKKNNKKKKGGGGMAGAVTGAGCATCACALSVIRVVLCVLCMLMSLCKGSCYCLLTTLCFLFFGTYLFLPVL